MHAPASGQGKSKHSQVHTCIRMHTCIRTCICTQQFKYTHTLKILQTLLDQWWASMGNFKRGGVPSRACASWSQRATWHLPRAPLAPTHPHRLPRCCRVVCPWPLQHSPAFRCTQTPTSVNTMHAFMCIGLSTYTSAHAHMRRNRHETNYKHTDRQPKRHIICRRHTDTLAHRSRHRCQSRHIHTRRRPKHRQRQHRPRLIDPDMGMAREILAPCT